MPQYQDRVSDLLAKAEPYHAAYYRADTFRGPSLYFHKRSLDARHSCDFTQYLEYVYATLASWGMHRMGKGGSKMESFTVFKKSVEPLKSRISAAEQIDYRCISAPDWEVLRELFFSIKIMASGTTLVGNSKVIAHMAPNIVPPIDREYTLRYLRGNTNIRNDLDYEWSLMKGIIADFFVPVARNPQFVAKADAWLANQSDYPWDTSLFKVIDNLVIGTGK